jgi:pimeloyl-ACP methyl ester carboxylesterase
MDLRGHGESDRPTPPSAYTADKMSQDILAVADACRIKRFAMWAMSYGGKVGRYLATRSARVTSLILMGTPLGPGVVGERRQQALDFLTHWHPIIQAQQAGTLDAHSLSDADQDVWSRLHVPSMLGWVRAMLDWPSVEPRDFCCPTLWLVGSEDRHAMDSLREYEGTLQKTQVRVQVASGLDHNQIFDEIDQVYPIMLGFTKSE